jgi:hypothetical protein
MMAAPAAYIVSAWLLAPVGGRYFRESASPDTKIVSVQSHRTTISRSALRVAPGRGRPSIHITGAGARARRLPFRSGALVIALEASNAACHSTSFGRRELRLRVGMAEPGRSGDR